MDFLHKLWDETVAGPTPDPGPGMTREYNSITESSRTKPIDIPVSVTRSITIIRNKNSSVLPDLHVDPVPDSPLGCSTPRTPLSPETPSDDFKRFSRRKSSGETMEREDPRIPTVYDWIVISALDR